MFAILAFGLSFTGVLTGMKSNAAVKAGERIEVIRKEVEQHREALGIGSYVDKLTLSTRDIIDEAQCQNFATAVDDEKNNITQCPSEYVLVGISGGRGHSSTWNEPHFLRCCRVRILP